MTPFKSNCTQCAGHIEHPVEISGTQINCPHCGQPTVLGVAARSSGPPPLPASVKKSYRKLLTNFAIVVGILIAIGRVYLFFEPAEMKYQRQLDDDKLAAYTEACRFIKASLPGAQKISEYRDASFDVNSSHFVVSVVVDGLNAFGGPVRNKIAVELWKDGKGGWMWQKILDQPAHQ